MSAIASSTVSIVPSATAFFSCSMSTELTLRALRLRRTDLRRLRAGVVLARQGCLDVDVADVAGEPLVRGYLPPDADDGDHDDHGDRGVVEGLQVERVVPGHRRGR